MKSPPLPHIGGQSNPSLRAPVAIRVGARFEASPERVFRAWLDPDVARRWLFATATRPIAHAEIDARIAGRFGFVERREASGAEHRGEYLEIVPHRRLVFSLALADRQRIVTVVTVEIAPRRMGSSLLLTHAQVPLDRADGIEARWTGMLYGLGVTLDSIDRDFPGERSLIARRGPLRRPALAERRVL